jgi:hypothetical protein
MKVKASIFILLLTIIAFMSLKGGRVSIAGFRSPSPENYGLLGSSDTLILISSFGYKVYLGGPYDVTPNSLYLVIAPEKAFSKVEVLSIKSAVKRGATLVVADETGIANSLLDFFNIKIAGTYVIANDTRGHGWEEVVRIRCDLGGRKISFISTRVSYIKAYPRWTIPICWIDDPRVSKKYVVGVYGHYGRGRILVLSDSTIFANFLLRGLYPQLGNTREVVKALIDFLSVPRGSKVIVDNKHYNLMYIKLSSIPYTFMTLLSAGATSLQKSLERARAYRASIALLSIAAGLAFLSIGPPARRILLQVSEEEKIISERAQDVILRCLDKIGEIEGNVKLRALALRISREKVFSYDDVKRLATRILREFR